MTYEHENGLQRSTVHVKELQGASRHLEVVARDPERGRYLVSSASQRGVFYRVDLVLGEMTGSCSCLWGQHGGVNCKHVLAALREHYCDEGRLSFWRNRDDALRQHRRMLDGYGMIATVRPRQAS